MVHGRNAQEHRNEPRHRRMTPHEVQKKLLDERMRQELAELETQVNVLYNDPHSTLELDDMVYLGSESVKHAMSMLPPSTPVAFHSDKGYHVMTIGDFMGIYSGEEPMVAEPLEDLVEERSLIGSSWNPESYAEAAHPSDPNWQFEELPSEVGLALMDEGYVLAVSSKRISLDEMVAAYSLVAAPGEELPAGFESTQLYEDLASLDVSLRQD